VALLRSDEDFEGEVGSCDSECAETAEDLAGKKGPMSAKVTAERREQGRLRVTLHRRNKERNTPDLLRRTSLIRRQIDLEH